MKKRKRIFGGREKRKQSRERMKIDIKETYEKAIEGGGTIHRRLDGLLEAR